MRAMRRNLKRCVLGSCAGMMAMQFGGCTIDLGDVAIPSSATVNIRDVLIGLVRTAILTPIDDFVTNGINTAFDAVDSDGN